ncbi:MAG: GDSL-type esterase/lipase family protein [Enterocloster bolteae]
MTEEISVEDTSECDGEYAREYTSGKGRQEKERMDTASEGQSRGQDEAAINTQLSLEITEAEAAIHTAEQAQGETGVHKDFSDTLFIGDSRTVGLSEYGDLGKAVVFADSGMSVFNLLDAQVSLGNGHKQNLDQVLSSANFKTIYLMLGINELGYDNPSIVRRYREIVDWIGKKQPEATLVLEANLHVTGEKSARNGIYNNQRINALNHAIRNIAEDTGCPYIDVNPIFDDGNGNLSAAYSTDGAHILGKYYSVWVDWIRGS